MNEKLDSISKGLEGGNVDLSLFRECYNVHSYEEKGSRPIGTVPCGSTAFDDTPKTLYRLLYLLGPSQVDFSEMYKSGGIVEIHSPDYEFCASVQFFKYELGLYFHCAVEHHGGASCNIQAGWPGADNGEYCASELGNRWYKVLVEYLSHELAVYPGNNFMV